MRPVLFFFLLLVLSACDAGGLPAAWRQTPMGTGPRVRWDLEAEPLPEIPLPNDVATWPDPSSPTGRRINASLISPTGIETRLRARFDELDGWGTFAPITVSFDAPIDTDDLIARQGEGRWSASDFRRHAIYLVDMETGDPVPIDINSGRFPLSVADPNAYYSNDPRGGGSNLLFETVEEDLDGDGVLDPGEDTDGDGVLDHPNTLDGRLLGTPLETYDRMLWFYERETDTLMFRPVLPLRENHTYAVVLTERLRGRDDGRPVRSPFEAVHHGAQYEDLAALPRLFAAHPDVYGGLTWDSVAFAWTFTTQSITGDLVALRDGLYGRGPFARLAEEFPARMVPVPLRGGRRCTPPPELYIVTPEELQTALEGLPLDGFGVPAEQLDAVIGALVDNVSHFAFGFYESPYLLGDPEAEDVNDTWHVDRTTGEARIGSDRVPIFVVVPKETAAHRQPFPVTLYAHGYGSLNLEAIAFAGLTARHGIATVTIDAQGHGLPLDAGLRGLLESILGSNCLAPLGTALSMDRARDLNADGTPDSAGLFFSAYMFHTRDTLRQSTLDILQALRIVRSFQGAPGQPDNRPWDPGSVIDPDGDPIEFTGDVNGDGAADLAGDFDGNGVPDLGGWDRPYMQWGSSLGGILSMLVTGVEPSIVAAAPVSGGGGLFDIGLRTSLSTARNPIWMRVMGPIVASAPSSGPGTNTGCADGERSIFFEVPDLSERWRTEMACATAEQLDEGDAVVILNYRNGESRCAAVSEGGRFRMQIPSDEGDPLELWVLDGAAQRLQAANCTFGGTGEQPEPSLIVSTWQSANGTVGMGTCPTCARYRDRVYELGAPLVSPVEGLGLRRQSPELRRLATLAQIAIDPADPVNYARNVFLDPITAEDVTPRTRSILVVATVGDTTVPVSAADTYARAAGVLAFLPADAPDELAQWRAPASFASRFFAASPDDVVLDNYVAEGLARLERTPVTGAPRFLFDVDDYSEGRQYFASDGGSQIPEAEGGLRPNRLDPPLRWARESRAITLATEDPWRGTGPFGHFSGIVHAMTLPLGQHVVLPVDPRKAWDDGAYFNNLIGWYLASQGTDLPYLSRPTEHQCLERSE
ncbi:MAG: hypothetical protein K8H88_29640, partial [Sandaracinaceae bacterium]|nr:hypothetical protein [Sandaracinaceae bacterium]